MFTLLLHGFLATQPTLDAPTYGHEVLVEQCGRRLVEDWDLDRGQRELVVQDIATDAILFVEVADAWVDVEDRADTLDLCALPG